MKTLMLRSAAGWILVTIIGFAAGVLASELFRLIVQLALEASRVAHDSWLAPALGAILGAFVAAGQSLILFHDGHTRWRWIIASSLGWAIGSIVGRALTSSPVGVPVSVWGDDRFPGLVGGFVCGTVVGLVQAYAVKWAGPIAVFWLVASGLAWALPADQLIGGSFGWLLWISVLTAIGGGDPWSGPKLVLLLGLIAAILTLPAVAWSRRAAIRAPAAT